MTKYKVYLFAFIILNNFSGCSKPGFSEPAVESLYPPADLDLPDHSVYGKTNYIKRINEFKASPLAAGDIVLLGDSITEFAGDWSMRLNAPKAKNRGIASDLTYGVLARLGEIGYYKPSYLFILIGINDLSKSKFSPAYVAGNISEIVRIVHSKSANTKIYVNTILPTTSTSLVSKIRETNDLLLTKSATEPFMLIDIYSLFADANGLMKSQYTTDGVHLTEAGYELWVRSRLAPILGTK